MTFLDGLKVLDCTNERGLIAGRLLADIGADVVVVEPPGGSTARNAPPLSGGRSLYWSTYSANKRSVECDLETEGDRSLFMELAARADILIESYDPGHLSDIGLGWEDL